MVRRSAAVFLILASLAKQELRLWPFSLTDPDILANLFRINFFLGAFNIFPAFPMDGGRVLRGILASRMDHTKATKIAVDIGQALAILMVVYGLIHTNLWLALIGVFIYLGAEGEEHATMIRAVLRNVPVTRAMLTDVQTVNPADPLGSVVEKACHSLQSDFPVVEGGEVIGILPKEVIFPAVHEKSLETPVSAIMRKEFLSAGTDETLDHIFQKMQGQNISLVPILEQGRVLGMINLEQIGKYHMMCGAAGR